MKRRMQTMNHVRQVQQRQQQDQQQNHEISNKGPRTPIQDHQSHPMQANIVGASPGGHVRRISSKMPNQSPMSMMSPQQHSTGEPDPKRFKPNPMAANSMTSQAMIEANRAQIIAAGQARPNGNYLINGHYIGPGNRIPVSNKPMPRNMPGGMGATMIRSSKPGQKPYYTNQQPMRPNMARRPAGMMMVSVYCNKILESMYL